MKRYLFIPSIVILSQEPYLAHSISFLLHVLTIVSENVLGLILSSIAILIPGLLALYLNFNTVVTMFSARGSATTVKWEFFVTWNWCMGASFLFSTIVVMDKLSKLNSTFSVLEVAPQDPLFSSSLIVMFISMAYLIGFFGVAVIKEEKLGRQNSAFSGLSASRIVSWLIPPLYYLVVLGVGLMISPSSSIRLPLVLISSLFVSVYVAFALLKLEGRDERKTAPKKEKKKRRRNKKKKMDDEMENEEEDNEKEEEFEDEMTKEVPIEEEGRGLHPFSPHPTASTIYHLTYLLKDILYHIIPTRFE